MKLNLNDLTQLHIPAPPSPAGERLLSKADRLYGKSEFLKEEGPSGRSDRTHLFANYLLDVGEMIGDELPFAFKDRSGRPVAWDRGCLGYLANRSPTEVELVERNGWVASIRVTEALKARYARDSEVDVLERDLDDLRHSEIAETQRRQLVNARLGQGQFRRDVLRFAGQCCAVTGCDVVELLRASHIKPWRESSNIERLDPRNGLALVAHLDVLFDRHLVSFDDKGEMLVSAKVRRSVPTEWGIGAPLRETPSQDTQRYLANHRAAFERFTHD